MSKKRGIRPSEAIGDALRGVARHILAEGRAAVEDEQRVEAIAVHDFRAAMKFWRAYLRLVEPVLDPADRSWRIEARGLARMFAGARDAQAAIDALADAERHSASDRLTSAAWESVRGTLEQLRASAETASLTPEMRQRIAGALGRAEARIEHWPLGDVVFADVARGLMKGYRRARDRIPSDGAAANPHELHELRQRVVAHRYQMEIVKPLWPRLGKTWVLEAQKLRTRLGKYQDLAVLARYAEPQQPLAQCRSGLQSAIGERQERHIASARRIAGRIFAEPPKAFRRRLEGMWQGIGGSD